MPRESTIKIQRSDTAAVTPSGLTAGELAVNLADRKLFVGGTTGNNITFLDASAVVTSFNGITGAVTGITAGGANTFTALNSFSAGISAGGNLVFNAVTAVFGASAANTTPITLYKDNSADNPAVDNSPFGNTTFDTPNNKVPLTLSFTEVYDPETGLTASTPGSTMIRVRNQNQNTDNFTVTDSGNVVCGTIVCSSIAPTAYIGNLSIDGGNLITLNWDGNLELGGQPPTVLSVYNSDTSANTLTLNGEGTFSKLSTSGTISGATGAFSKLLTASEGISAGGTTAATFNGTVDMNFNTLYEPTLRYYNEVLASPAISANVLTLDLSTAQMFTVSLNANITTFTITNTPATANRSIGFTLIFTADGTARTVTWGAAVKWANNDAPSLTSTNAKKDILSFVSTDAGTTWYGFIGGLNF